MRQQLQRRLYHVHAAGRSLGESVFSGREGGIPALAPTMSSGVSLKKYISIF
jgi:hypothetical protein